MNGSGIWGTGGLDWSRWPNFSRAEMACRCGCDRADMDPAFMDWLQRLRDIVDFPLPVSSGYRCPDHNAKVSVTGRDGPHTTGLAADIRVAGDAAFEVLQAAMETWVSGVGVRQHGLRSDRFLHLDRLPCAGPAPRPRIWSY